VLVEQKDNIKYNCWCHPGSPQKRKNFLDKLRQPPYHESEAIYLTSQSLQWINDKKLNVFGVNHA
jgi:hypothetical protein